MASSLAKQLSTSPASWFGSAFSHLVLSRRVLDQLGPAIAAWHSLFVYGPPGNGKTVIAQAIRNVLQGEMAIPHAHHDRRSHHPHLRSGEPRAGRRRRWTTPGWRNISVRRPLGAVPAAAHHRRWRTDAGRARAGLQRVLGSLQRAAPGARQRRRAADRRLRPSAGASARPAQSLDRAAREPRRLSHAANRPEIRAAVPCVRGICHQPETLRAGGRSVSAPHSVQGAGRIADGGRVHRDLRELLSRTSISTSTGRSPNTSCNKGTAPRGYGFAHAIRAI